VILEFVSRAQAATLNSPLAPALEAIEYVNMDFIAEFNSTNIYRGPPTPEREKAWFDLTYSKLFSAHHCAQIC
jgi:hypothetical protein